MAQSSAKVGQKRFEHDQFVGTIDNAHVRVELPPAGQLVAYAAERGVTARANQDGRVLADHPRRPFPIEVLTYAEIDALAATRAGAFR